MNPLHSSLAPATGRITPEQVAEAIAKTCPPDSYRDKRVLLIVPDGTRTAPVGLLFQTLFQQIGRVVRQLDVIAALGTHQPMSETQFCERLEISAEARRSTYGQVRFFNHEWNNPK